MTIETAAAILGLKHVEVGRLKFHPTYDHKTGTVAASVVGR